MNTQELFWDLPDYQPPCPPLTECMLREAEHQLGVVLPKSLVEVLMIQNGGVLRPNRFYVGTDKEEFPDASEQGHISITGLDGICNELGRWNESMQGQWGYPQNSVVLCHQGHGGFALRYEDPGSPEVIFVYSECYPFVLS